MTGRPQVGELEAEVLSVLAGSRLWALTPSEVAGRARRRALRPPGRHDLPDAAAAPRSLQPVKGEGLSYQYRLAVDESGLIAGRMHSQLRYAHDAAGALGHFVSGLSSDEEAALRRVLRNSDGKR